MCDDDERDRDRARDAIRGLVITHSRFSGSMAGASRRCRRRPPADPALTRGDGGRPPLDPRRNPPRPGGAPGELDFYPSDAVDDAFVERFGIIGRAEHCAERLQAILDLGITRIYIGTRSVGVDLEERNTLRLGREVLPLLRRAPSPDSSP